MKGKRHVFVTGYPGFIGKRLVERLTERGAKLTCLIEERFSEAAENHAARLPHGSIQILAGDITKADLGLEGKALERLRRTITDVYHLAAVYDLRVSREVGERVNVGGTANVLDFCSALEKLHCLAYVSTCYVSGEWRGVFYEENLDKGQKFKNHYEETKFRAEVLVRERMDQLPTVVLRPAIVVGDSRTGETDKFDGPYVTFGAIRRGLLFLAPGRGAVPINIVPVDFVLDCMVAIPEIDGATGRTYHLADPDPVDVIELVKLVSDRMGVSRPLGHYPVQLLELALSIPSLSELFGIPPETVRYFNHPVVYDSTNTQQILRGTAISCPPIRSYLNTLLKFYLNLK